MFVSFFSDVFVVNPSMMSVTLSIKGNCDFVKFVRKIKHNTVSGSFSSLDVCLSLSLSLSLSLCVCVCVKDSQLTGVLNIQHTFAYSNSKHT